ncbi:MAG: hypothetical protein QOH45_1687, partial [Pseudonocardiales bacterium]|nr:hypothetical protein [Pseudonocardiales bacterium]
MRPDFAGATGEDVELLARHVGEMLSDQAPAAYAANPRSY